MKRFIGRIALVAAVPALAVTVFAGSASADADSFITDLNSMGHPQTQGTRQSAINLGYSICDELSHGESQADVVVQMSRNGWGGQESADWVVVATQDLCPQYQ